MISSRPAGLVKEGKEVRSALSNQSRIDPAFESLLRRLIELSSPFFAIQILTNKVNTSIPGHGLDISPPWRSKVQDTWAHSPGLKALLGVLTVQAQASTPSAAESERRKKTRTKKRAGRGRAIVLTRWWVGRKDRVEVARSRAGRTRRLAGIAGQLSRPGQRSRRHCIQQQYSRCFKAFKGIEWAFQRVGVNRVMERRARFSRLEISAFGARPPNLLGQQDNLLKPGEP